MEISVYFCQSFVNTDSPLQRVKGQEKSASLEDTNLTVKSMYEQGWRLAHAIKTAGSAQLESFNFLLVFERATP